MSELPENGVSYTPLRYWCPLDNHEPHRKETSGTALAYVRADGAPSIKFRGEDANRFDDLTRAIYLIDDGKTVVPHYAAGWRFNTVDDPQDREEYLLIQPFPTNPDDRMREDNGRVIDYSMWALGPRRAYHVKIFPKY